jgi:segregation and condensation protein B
MEQRDENPKEEPEATDTDSEPADNETETEIEEELVEAQKKEPKLISQIEAALFLAGRPLGELELASFFGTDRITVRWALRQIKKFLIDQNSALEILHLTKDRWVLQLCEEFSRGLYNYIQEFIPKEEMLTKEEVDTLTEIAYRQPITSVLLVKIIGRPNVYDHIKRLAEKGLINMEKQEKSNLLTTSKKFADIYGFDPELRNLKIQLVWRLKKRAGLDYD